MKLAISERVDVLNEPCFFIPATMVEKAIKSIVRLPIFMELNILAFLVFLKLRF